MTTIFIGSSAAAKSQARAIIRSCTRPGLKFLPWWNAFTAGRTLLRDLESIHIAGSSSFRRGAALPVGKRSLREFERWVGALK